MAKQVFALKEKVRVRGHKDEATIEEIYDDIPGGVRLSHQISGFYSWNVEHLERAGDAPVKRRRKDK